MIPHLAGSVRESIGVSLGFRKWRSPVSPESWSPFQSTLLPLPGSNRFWDTVTEFKRLIESRRVLLFPPFALTHVVDFIDSGCFWNNTSAIANPKQEVNRHGITPGVLTGSETQELALKFLLLRDCVPFIVIQDQLIGGVLN
jgi:hypothetical protein